MEGTDPGGASPSHPADPQVQRPYPPGDGGRSKRIIVFVGGLRPQPQRPEKMTSALGYWKITGRFFCLEDGMKLCENGILYDTATDQPLAAFQFSLCGVPAEEAAYRGPEGRCFLVRRIGDHETCCPPRKRRCSAGRPIGNNSPTGYGTEYRGGSMLNLFFAPV